MIDLFYFITNDWFMSFVRVKDCLDLLVLSRLISLLKETTHLFFFSYKWLIYTTWIANKQLYITSASYRSFYLFSLTMILYFILFILLLEDMTDLYYLLTILVYLFHHDYLILILKEMTNEAYNDWTVIFFYNFNIYIFFDKKLIIFLINSLSI